MLNRLVLWLWFEKKLFLVVVGLIEICVRLKLWLKLQLKKTLYQRCLVVTMIDVDVTNKMIKKKTCINFLFFHPPNVYSITQSNEKWTWLRISSWFFCSTRWWNSGRW